MKVPFSYANAVAISAQKTLIPKSRFLSAAEAGSASEALEILTSTGFGKNAEIGGANEYDTLVEAETVALKKFVSEYADGDVAYYCFLKSDFFNCDVAVRRAYCGFGGEYAPDGTVDTSLIEQYVRTGKGELPDYLKKAIDDLVAVSKRADRTGTDFSVATLKNYYAAALKLIKRPTIKGLIRAEIDCGNISAYFRSPDRDTAEKQFIEGGKIKRDKMLVILGGDASRIRSAFLFTSYKDAIEACLKAKADGKPLSVFEKIKDDYPMQRLYGKRYASEGVTPVLLYAAYKRAEIGNFRTVVSGKLAGANPEAITGRLRDGYVG